AGSSSSPLVKGWISNPIPPGGTASGSLTIKVDSSANSASYSSGTLTIPASNLPNGQTELVAGQSYPIQLIVNYANGQSQTITATITASSS
ncbi:MAG: hypothetical protein ACP5G6_09030, partial [Conexivisphaera sp.]